MAAEQRAARTELGKRGALGSRHDARSGRDGGARSGAGGSRTWLPSDGWWRSEPWNVATVADRETVKAKSACAALLYAAEDLSVVAWLAPQLPEKYVPQLRPLAREFAWVCRWAWPLLEPYPRARYEVIARLRPGLDRLGSHDLDGAYPGRKPRSVSTLKQKWQWQLTPPRRHRRMRVPTDEQLAKDAARLAVMAEAIHEIAMRMQLRFPPAAAVTEAVERFVAQQAAA